MAIFIVSLVLLLSIFLEATLIHIPFVLLALLSLVVIYRGYSAFFIALFVGLVLDSLLMRPFGQTSLFYVIFLFLIFLYQQKFELRTISFILVMSFFGSVWYLLLFGHQLFFVQLGVSILIGGLFFILLSWVDNRFQKPEKIPYSA